MSNQSIATRPRAQILQVGLVIDKPSLCWDTHRIVYDPEPETLVTLWNMDLLGIVPRVEVMPDGSVLMGGYAIDELREISNECYGNVRGRG